jgi:outer membrane cobalamin receptor
VEVAARNRYLETNGFYRRQQSSRQGTILTREEIERRNPPFISQMLTTVPGTRLDRDSFGTTVLRSTRDGCELTVWLDGMRVPGFDIDTYPVDAIEAIEIWRGMSVPPEFRDPCGVLLIWSRRP